MTDETKQTWMGYTDAAEAGNNDQKTYRDFDWNIWLLKVVDFLNIIYEWFMQLNSDSPPLFFPFYIFTKHTDLLS